MLHTLLYIYIYIYICVCKYWCVKCCDTCDVHVDIMYECVYIYICRYPRMSRMPMM